MPDNFMPQSEIFFKKASSDLKLARYAHGIEDEELDIEIIFFHLQQAAEKYLKCLLSHHNVHFTKTHDLERLIAICEENAIALPAYVSDFVDLNPYAVEGRYAMVCDDYSDADRYLNLLEQFRKYVDELVNPPVATVEIKS